jgi:hypothetical protein
LLASSRVETVEGREREVTHRWRFRIGEAFPADSPLARFIVAVAAGMNDNVLANGLFVESERDFEHLYFFSLANSHLYEVAETLHKAHREWEEVRDFVDALDEARQQDFTMIKALAEPAGDWPSNRLKELRNMFFHYLRLDGAAVDAGRLPLLRGLADAADMEGEVVIEAGGPLNGIRARFTDEVFVKALTATYENGELERLVAALADYQPALNRFAQAALGRFLRELPDGVVASEGGRDDGQL